MKMPQPFTHFPWFICMWGAISHNAVRAQPPFSCCILNLVKSCRSKSKFRRRVQMQLIAQNRIYFDVLLQILVIDSKLKGTYTRPMDFWWAFPKLYRFLKNCLSLTFSRLFMVHELGLVHELGTHRYWWRLFQKWTFLCIIMVLGCMRNGTPVLWYCGPRVVSHVNSSVKI